MRIFLVNLLPSDIRERVRTKDRRRRLGLLIVLLFCSLVGVSLHSWDQARRARAVRDAALTSLDRVHDVDGELARLEAERQRLGAFMDTYRRISLPMRLCDLIATIANAMPEKTTLTDCSFKVSVRPVEGAPAAPAAPGAPPKPPPQERVLEIRLRGYAAGNAEMSAFDRALAATPPLVRVALSENRSIETPDGDFQEFVITAEVPLDREYTTPREARPLAFDDRAGAPSREAVHR